MNAHVMPHIHLEEVIYVLNLSIALWVEGHQELKINPLQLEKLRSKVFGELWISITCDALRNSP